MNGQVRDTLINPYTKSDQQPTDLWGFAPPDEGWGEDSASLSEIPDIVLKGTDLSDDWTGRDDRVAVRVSDLRDRYGARYRPVSREEED